MKIFEMFLLWHVVWAFQKSLSHWFRIYLTSRFASALPHCNRKSHSPITFRYKLKVKTTLRGRRIGKKRCLWLLSHVRKFLKRRHKTKMITQDLTNISVFYHTYKKDPDYGPDIEPRLWNLNKAPRQWKFRPRSWILAWNKSEIKKERLSWNWYKSYKTVHRLNKMIILK